MASTQPFGKLRTGAFRLQVMAMVGSDVVGLVKNAGGADPEWLRPPERAGFAVKTAEKATCAVLLRDGVEPFLARAAKEARMRIGPSAR